MVQDVCFHDFEYVDAISDADVLAFSYRVQEKTPFNVPLFSQACILHDFSEKSKTFGDSLPSHETRFCTKKVRVSAFWSFYDMECAGCFLRMLSGKRPGMSGKLNVSHYKKP